MGFFKDTFEASWIRVVWENASFKKWLHSEVKVPDISTDRFLHMPEDSPDGRKVWHRSIPGVFIILSKTCSRKRLADGVTQDGVLYIAKTKVMAAGAVALQQLA